MSEDQNAQAAQNNTDAVEQNTVVQENTKGGEDVPKAKPKGASGQGDDPSEKEKTPSETGEAKKAPETYSEFSVPEGMRLDTDLSAKFTGLAKEFDLNQEQAQKLVDLAIENATSILGHTSKQWEEVRSKWKTDIENDKEYGGNKFTETLELAQRALRKFGTDELNTFLNSSGYGDNPELIKLLAKIGKAVGEDKTVTGVGTNVQNIADKFYDKS